MRTKLFISLLALALFLLAAAFAQPSIVWQTSLGGSDWDVASSIQQTTDGGFIVAGSSNSNDGDVIGHYPGGHYESDSTWYEYPDYWVVKLNSAGNIEWQKCLGGGGDDEAHSIQQTTDGGFIVAGYSESNDGDVSGHHPGRYWYDSTRYEPDYWVVKLNSAGNIEWQKCLGGSGDDRASSIQQTADGGFIVAGYSESNDGDVSGHHVPDYNSDYWVVKLNSAGNIEWQKCLGGSGRDYASSIQQTADGGFIVAGISNSNDGDVSENHGDYDYWVVKLNSAGDIEWQKCRGGSDSDGAFSIQQTSDGGFIVAGRSYSNDGDVIGHHHGGYYKSDSTWYEYPDYWVVKLNSAGNIVWQKSLGGSDYDEAWSIKQTADGGFIIAGLSDSNDGDVIGWHEGYGHFGNPTYDCWVVNLNSAGEIVWQKSLGGSSRDGTFSIQRTSDGGFIVAGYSDSNDGDVSGHHHGGYYYKSDSTWYEYPDYWVVKLSPEKK